MIKKIIKFFDKLEDKIRFRLSKHPIPYSIIGGIFVVLFWKGVWDTVDMFPFFSGPILVVISLTVLLITGLLVSFFVTDRIIHSGWKKEEKIILKTESEAKESEKLIKEVIIEINELKKTNSEIKEILLKK